MFNDIKLTAEERDNLNREIIGRKLDTVTPKIIVDEKPELKGFLITKEIRETDLEKILESRIKQVKEQRDISLKEKNEDKKEEEEFNLESLNLLKEEASSNSLIINLRALRYSVAEIMINSYKTQNPQEKPELFEKYMILLRQEFMKILDSNLTIQRQKMRVCDVSSKYIIKLCEDITIKRVLMESEREKEIELEKYDDKVKKCNEKIEALSLKKSNENNDAINKYKMLKTGIIEEQEKFRKKAEEKEKEIAKEIRNKNSKQKANESATTNVAIEGEIAAAKSFLNTTLISYPAKLTPQQTKQKIELEQIQQKIEIAEIYFKKYNNFLKSKHRETKEQAETAIANYNRNYSNNNYSGIENVRLIDLVSPDSLNPEKLFEKIYGIDNEKQFSTK